MNQPRFETMNSEEVLAAVDAALRKVHQQYAEGTLDLSGRCYTDEELAAGAATGGVVRPARAPKATAA